MTQGDATVSNNDVMEWNTKSRQPLSRHHHLGPSCEYDGTGDKFCMSFIGPLGENCNLNKTVTTFICIRSRWLNLSRVIQFYLIYKLLPVIICRYVFGLNVICGNVVSGNAAAPARFRSFVFLATSCFGFYSQLRSAFYFQIFSPSSKSMSTFSLHFVSFFDSGLAWTYEQDFQMFLFCWKRCWARGHTTLAR